MATIYLKSRKEPIIMPNERAMKIKNRWLGYGVDKAEKDDLIDLGDWAGEYGQIRSIELDKGPGPAPTTKPVVLGGVVRFEPLDYKLKDNEEFV